MADDAEKKPRARAAAKTNTETSVTEAPDVTEATKVVVGDTPKNSVSPKNAVVGNADTDEIYLSRIVYRNMAAKKSLSVHHLQRRLNDLGYTEAYADKDGFYGDLTKNSVEAFQKDHDLLVTGIVDQGTMAEIFDGDPNVTVKFN